MNDKSIGPELLERYQELFASLLTISADNVEVSARAGSVALDTVVQCQTEEKYDTLDTILRSKKLTADLFSYLDVMDLLGTCCAAFAAAGYLGML